MARGKSNHEARFEKWQRLAPPATRLLSSLVSSTLVARLEEHGFERVGHSLRQSDQPVSGREIELERWSEGWVDSVTFNFDKYGAPRFQIHLSRRSSEPSHAWVHAGNLVRRPGQHLHFWGKPWWLPLPLWSEQASRRVVARLESLLPDGLAFLASGERSRHISRAAGITGAA